jgi:hypothetical protein
MGMVDIMMRLMRPTTETKFHIDMDWWEEQGRNLRFHVYNRLCSDCRALYSSYEDAGDVDWIDDQTAEVTRVDALRHTLRTCCSTKPDYITEDMPFAEAIFRVFLANGNAPLSPLELHEVLNRRPPRTIVRMLTQARVYNGIKPIL